MTAKRNKLEKREEEKNDAKKLNTTQAEWIADFSDVEKDDESDDDEEDDDTTTSWAMTMISKKTRLMWMIFF